MSPFSSVRYNAAHAEVISCIATLAWMITLLTITGIAQAGTFTKHELKYDGQTREYRVYRPAGISRDDTTPAIIAFHGFMSDPAGLRWLTKMDKSADKHRFVIIYPAAIKGSFNAGKGSGTKNTDIDEAKFLSHLLDTIVSRHNLDSTRIYSMGFSNGAQMSALSMCEFAPRLAAIAMVAHSLNIENCDPSQAVPAVLIQGAKDPYIPFGGGGKFNLRSHKESVRLLTEMNEVSHVGKIIIDTASIRCRQYGSAVRSCVGYNDGHTWPGGEEFKTEQFGKTNQDLNANDFIMSFFKKHSLAGSAPKAAVAQIEADASVYTQAQPSRGNSPATGDRSKLSRGIYPGS